MLTVSLSWYVVGWLCLHWNDCHCVSLPQLTLALAQESAAYLSSLLTDGRLLGNFLKASWTLCDSTLTLKAVPPSAVLLPLVELSSANSFLLSGNSPQAACLRPMVTCNSQGVCTSIAQR